MSAMELLAEMRAKRTHLAIVLDEYGGTDGLLTIELVREVPEAMKPKKIAVTTGDTPVAIEQRHAA